jgi:hypothetical protein
MEKARNFSFSFGCVAIYSAQFEKKNVSFVVM